MRDRHMGRETMNLKKYRPQPISQADIDRPDNRYVQDWNKAYPSIWRRLWNWLNGVPKWALTVIVLVCYPAQLKTKLEDALGRIFENVTMVIENWPGWKDFYDLQESDPERKNCPGREEKKIPHLKVVKF